MSKQAELTKTLGGNMDASLGKGPKVAPPGDAKGPARRGPSPRHRGLRRGEETAQVPIGMIRPDPEQPRKGFDPEKLFDLAESLRLKGQLQPIRVRWIEAEGTYRIVMGERRFRAACDAGLPSLLCVIDDVERTPSEILTLQVIENCLRDDLKPIEEAEGYRRLIDANGWTQKQVAEAVGVAQGTIAKALMLLELPESIRGAIGAGRLKASTGRELLRIGHLPERQLELAQRAIDQSLGREVVARKVDAWLAEERAATWRGLPLNSILDVPPEILGPLARAGITLCGTAWDGIASTHLAGEGIVDAGQLARLQRALDALRRDKGDPPGSPVVAGPLERPARPGRRPAAMPAGPVARDLPGRARPFDGPKPRGDPGEYSPGMTAGGPVDLSLFPMSHQCANGVRISLEAESDELEEEAPRAVEALRELARIIDDRYRADRLRSIRAKKGRKAGEKANVDAMGGPDDGAAGGRDGAIR